MSALTWILCRLPVSMAVVLRELPVTMPILLLACSSAAASPVPTGYQSVAREHGIAPSILYALALTESGTRLANGAFRPWPWTLNVEGAGRYFPTRAAAYAAIQAYRSAGKRSIDIGLMQINWRYHKDRLRNPWQALAPYFNLRTAARILKAHFTDTGDWWIAVGRYHSPGDSAAAKARAERYRERVKRHWQRLVSDHG